LSIGNVEEWRIKTNGFYFRSGAFKNTDGKLAIKAAAHQR
jgi:hypothetical protein